MILHSADVRSILLLDSTYVPVLSGNEATFTGGSAMIGTAWVVLAHTRSNLLTFSFTSSGTSWVSSGKIARR